MPSNQQQALLDCDCGCEEPVPPCNPCPDGTIYPWLVTILFVELGIAVESANEQDAEEDGELTFLYRVEGAYTNDDGKEYSFQCLFRECEAEISINPTEPGDFTCLGGGVTDTGVVTMNAVSCPTVPPVEPLVLIYTIECPQGPILTVVVTGPL